VRRDDDERSTLSRRALLWGGALLGAGAAIGHAVQLRADDAAPGTPAEALARLRAGQARFAAGQTTQPRRDLERLRQVAPKQTPFAAVLACADSRVPVEILYDQGFGDLFVVRVAGNVASAVAIASLEYSAHALGAKAIVVLGHGDCGAVRAALAGGEVPGQISVLYQHIAPALDRTRMDLAAATAANVRYQARKLRKGSTVLGPKLAAGQLALVGGVFDLTTGAVTAVEL
jgi:carbonic anhydrase